MMPIFNEDFSAPFADRIVNSRPLITTEAKANLKNRWGLFFIALF